MISFGVMSQYALVASAAFSANPNAPTGNGQENALLMHNLNFSGSSLKFDSHTTDSYKDGELLFEQMREIVDDLCVNTSPNAILCGELESLRCYGFRIFSLSEGSYASKMCRQKDLLYFYFNQMESLVPPFVYNDYVKALGDGNLDDCYKILNSVFGKISTEEAAYLAAYKIRDRLNGKHQRGVLFVDVLSGKTFFMEQRRRDSGEKGGKNRILLVPNGFLNLYKFFGYSLYLVDLMVSTSSYASEIRAVESALIGGKTFKGANVTINVESRELPVCKILTYKYFVYTVFSMEVCGLPSTTIKKTIAALREKMFEVQNSVILIRKEVDILGYLNVVVLSNKK